MPAGLPKLEVSFFLNADGILVVKTKEVRSGVEQSIEVKPQYGLTDAEVEAMLQDSIFHAKEDIAMRALVEAKTEAFQMIETSISFMEKHKQYLAEEEIGRTMKAVDELRTIAGTDYKDMIQAKIEELNEITRPFSERIMDLAVKTALKGKKI
jgi:molecular chaperone HscA